MYITGKDYTTELHTLDKKDVHRICWKWQITTDKGGLNKSYLYMKKSALDMKEIVYILGSMLPKWISEDVITLAVH